MGEEKWDGWAVEVRGRERGLEWSLGACRRVERRKEEKLKDEQ